MADIFVATNGNDTTGVGSLSNPFATITKADSVASPGDTIVLRAGNYNQRWAPTKNSLTLRSHTGEVAVLRGVNNTNYVIDVNSRNDIVIRDVEINYNPAHTFPSTDMPHVFIRGSSQRTKLINCTIWRAWLGTGTQDYNSGRRDAGVRITAGATSTEIDGCTIYGFNKNIHLMNSPQLFWIHHCDLYDSILSTIHFAGNTNSRVMGGLIEHNDLGHSFMEDNIQTNDASVPDNAAPTILGVRVRYNSFYYAGEQAIDLKNAEYFVIEYNVFRRSVGSGDGLHATRGLNENAFGTVTKGSVNTRQTRRHVIRHNITFDSSCWGLLWEKTCYYNNTSINNNHSINGSNGVGTHAGSLPKWWNMRQREGQSIRFVGYKNNVSANHASCGMVLRFHINNQDMDLDYNVYVNELVGEQPSSGAWFSLDPAQYRARIAQMGWNTEGEANSNFTHPNVAALKMVNVPEKPVYSGSYNFNLQVDSPLRNAGGHLTRADGAGTNSNQLRMVNPFYFQDGQGRANEGDTIFIEGVGSRRITAINESTRVCTLNSNASWADGARIWFGSSSTVNIGATNHEAPPPSPSAPTITSSPVTTGVDGQAYQYQIQATGNPTPTYSLLTGPTNMTLNTSTGLLSWASPVVGEHSVSVQASNGVLPNATQSWTLTISALPPDPEAPTITSSPSTTGSTASQYVYQAEATGHPAITWSLDVAPSGMTINSIGGLVSWPSPVEGVHTVRVRAANGVSPDDTQEYSLSISTPVGPGGGDTFPAVAVSEVVGTMTTLYPRETVAEPKAVMGVVVMATDEETVTNGADIGIGFSDLTNEGAVSMNARNGVNPAWSRRASVDDGYLAMLAPTTSTITTKATVTGVTTSQIERNWPLDPGVLYKFYDVLFEASSAKAGIAAIQVTEDASTAVSLDFRPNLILLAATGKSIPASHANGRITFGVVVDDGVETDQISFATWFQDSVNPPNIASKITPDFVLTEVSNAGNLQRRVELEGLDETGFDLTTRNQDWSEPTPKTTYLAIEAEGRTAMGVLATPTTSGQQPISLGWEAGYVGFLVTLLPASSFDGAADATAGGWALGVWDGENGLCAGITSRDGTSGNTVTRSVYSRSPIILPKHDGSTGLQAFIESPSEDGFTLSWLNVLDYEASVIWWAIEKVSQDRADEAANPAIEEVSTFPITGLLGDAEAEGASPAVEEVSTPEATGTLEPYGIMLSPATEYVRTLPASAVYGDVEIALSPIMTHEKFTVRSAVVINITDLFKMKLKKRVRVFTPPRSDTMSVREVIESPTEQGTREEKVWPIDTKRWGGSPSSPQVEVYEVLEDGELRDVSNERLSGEPAVVGDIIFAPTLSGVEPYQRYRLVYRWRFGLEVVEAYAEIVGTQ